MIPISHVLPNISDTHPVVLSNRSDIPIPQVLPNISDTHPSCLTKHKWYPSLRSYRTEAIYPSLRSYWTEAILIPEVLPNRSDSRPSRSGISCTSTVPSSSRYCCGSDGAGKRRSPSCFNMKINSQDFRLCPEPLTRARNSSSNWAVQEPLLLLLLLMMLLIYCWSWCYYCCCCCTKGLFTLNVFYPVLLKRPIFEVGSPP